jgi:hypothetical protein
MRWERNGIRKFSKNCREIFAKILAKTKILQKFYRKLKIPQKFLRKRIILRNFTVIPHAWCMRCKFLHFRRIKITDLEFLQKLSQNFLRQFPLFSQRNFRKNENKFLRTFAGKCENENFRFNPFHYYKMCNPIVINLKHNGIFTPIIIIKFKS